MRKIILLVTSFTTALVANCQSLDPSFGGKGYKSFDFLTGNFYYESGGQALRKADGSFFVLYQVNGYTVFSHYSSNGERDAAFGNSGYSQTLSITEARADLQPDGKIVVAGTIFNSESHTSDFGVARLNANGFLDKGFANAGYQRIDFFGDDDLPSSIVSQSNGKVLVGGRAYNPANGVSDFALVRLNTNGTLDESFDNDGKQTTDFSGNSDEVEAIAVLPGGKIVAGGETYNDATGHYSMAVARYNADGSLDKSFSGDGKKTTSFTGTDGLTHALAVQTDGKIVLAGEVGEAFVEPTSAALVRYNVNGSLDNSFSGDGKATIDFGDTINVATAIVVQPDGKLVIGGYAYSPKEGNDDFVLARFNSNGTPDKTFGKDGKVKTDFDRGYDEIVSVIVLPDGKILASGTVFSSNADNGDYAMALYNADGKLEHKFGHKGFVTGYYKAGDSHVNAVAVQVDGKVVVAGSAYTGKTLSDFAVARFNADGSLDKTFGNDGKVTTDFLEDYDEALDVVIQPDGKIVVTGAAFNETTFSNEVALARYLPDGSLDKRFARKGKTTFASTDQDNIARKLGLQADGKIIVLGETSDGPEGTSDFLLLRYTTSGSLDNSFSGDGVVTTDFSGTQDFGSSLIVQPDGKLVAGGYSFTQTNSTFSLARYNSNGTLDKSFGGNGKTVTTFDLDVFGPDMALRTDGKIVVAGGSYDLSADVSGYALARYDKNGILDKTFDGDGKKLVKDLDPNINFIRMGLQSDEKIVVLGYIPNKTAGFLDFSLTRFTTAGEFDKTFSGDGTLTSRLFGFDNIPTDLVIKNSKAYVSGFAYDPSQVSIVAVYQLGPSALATPQVSNQRTIEATNNANEALALAVKALPNPSTQYFTLSIQNGGNGAVQVKISDAAGRLVEAKTNIAPNSMLQVGQAYRPGIYYVEIVQGGRKSVVTLVKQ